MATTQHRIVNLIVNICLTGLVLNLIDLTLPPSIILFRIDHTTFHTSTMGVYTRSDLFQYKNNPICYGRLPQDAWRTILSLGIERDEFRPTHRGVRAGLQRKRKQAAKLNRNITRRRNCNFLNVCHWNAQSVRNKTTFCSDYVTDHNVDIMCLTETWLNAEKDQVAIGELKRKNETKKYFTEWKHNFALFRAYPSEYQIDNAVQGIRNQQVLTRYEKKNWRQKLK